MGISRLADVRDKPSRSKFKTYAIGYVHIDIAEVRTEEGKLHLFAGIDRTSKLVFARLETKATRRLKTLRGLTPYEFVIQQRTKKQKRSKTDPSNHTLGPNT